MRGAELRHQLNRLAAHFDQLARPSHGRYVREPAITDESGVRFVPPPVFPTSGLVVAVGAGVAVGALSAGRRD
jgi:hypothetical protein